MKKVLTKFLAIGSVALLMFASCKKEGTLATSNGGKAGTLSASATTLPLDRSKVNDTTKIIKFTFSSANYGFNAAIKNTLQIDAAGDNWANPTSVTLPANVTSMGYTTVDFNNIVLKLNLTAGVASQVMVRISHSISTSITPVYSNVVSLSVTPFNLTSWVYVPGAYEGSSWPNPGPLEDSLVSITGNGVYTGVIGFTPGNDQFLIVPQKNWNHKYATPDGANSSDPAIYSVVYDGPNNFYAPIKATVDPTVNITSNKLTLDINKNTLTLVPTLWSIVGDASPGGWPNGSGYQSDTDMKFNNGTQLWWSVVNLTAGGAIKFRLNHDWGTNLGGSGGTLSLNGANISIATAGKYLVTLDPVGLTYTITPN